MNNQNQNPFIPQGSFLDQKTRNRAHVKIAVSIVLAINGVGLLALLMLGCQKESAPQQTQETPTNAPPAFEATNVPPPVVEATNPPPVVETAPPVVAPVVPVPAPGATEYTIVQGDTFGSLAKKFHVSLNAITQANPGVDPTKLQIGKKIHIPAPAAPAPPSITAPPADLAAGEQIYSVKSGDTLTKIATQFGTTVKALRTANNLKTDRLNVGQKLKIPAKAAAPPPPTSAPIPAPEPAAPTAPAPGK
jgi:LysM repeat protein